MLILRSFKLLYFIIFLITVLFLIHTSVSAQVVSSSLNENYLQKEESKRKRSNVLLWAILAKGEPTSGRVIPLKIVNLNFYIEQIEGQKPFVKLNGFFNDSHKINSVRILFWVENGQQTWGYPSLDQGGVSFEYSHELNEYATSGVYAIRRIDVLTNDGTIKFTDTSLVTSGFDVKYEFNNSKQDLENPVIDLFTISDMQYDSERKNYYLSYLVQASDAQSGLTNDVIIELKNQSGSSLQTRLYFNESGYAEGRFDFNQYAASGIYIVNTIRLADKAGNHPWYSTSEIESMGFQTEVYLDNPFQDVLAPVLETFTINEFKANNEKGIQLDFSASDNMSGFNRAYIRMRNEAGDLYDAWIYTNSYKILVPASHYGQKIQVVFFRLYDSAENIRQYSKDDLDALNFDSEIFIQN